MKTFFLVFFIFSTTLLAQRVVEGTVYQTGTDQPLLGVNIIKNGTVEGITTDFDGNFTINDASAGDVYTFSYVGFKTLEVVISDSDQLTIFLEQDSEFLDEIVVVGYGSQRKSNVVGSVVSVEVDKANKVPTTNVTELLMDRRQTGGNRQSHIVHQALRGSSCATVGAVEGDEVGCGSDATKVNGVA